VEADGFYQVINGLREGDRIVTSSQFLIDSESNLKAAVGAMVSESAAGVEAMVGESTDAVSGDEGHDH